MPRRANRRDDGERKIVGKLRELGFRVWYDLPVDLLAYHAACGLQGIEVKDGKKPLSARRLTVIERNFLMSVGTSGRVIKSVAEAEEWAERVACEHSYNRVIDGFGNG